MDRAATFPDVTLAILAGGQGTRLGGVAKGLLSVGGLTTLERLRAFGSRFRDTLLVANVPEPYDRFGIRTVADTVQGKGAPGGVHAALGAARTPWVFVVACDMPFVTEPAARVVLDARGEDVDAVCLEHDGRWEPLFAAYRTELVTRWGEALSEDPSMRRVLTRFRTRTLPVDALRAVDPELRALANVNRPEDLARYGVTLPER
ncbi:molybdenum cofactor guanylyltransferase [Corallococcus aberystwythensis]|uniref:Probable molybdenum cofactor guanylyltransferase n=1 Tax=Corallococcus aberystwythensis TaxID=2316722 RepID=A0A3A8PLM9_9BACT|nr:molybdenum cofactor guanylyltransferase [Corallococcus aberystwythensis]RKH57286.1 molybdenum cofactor guanylyltransferase [Corallococcus aberystwythensis]